MVAYSPFLSALALWDLIPEASSLFGLVSRPRLPPLTAPPSVATVCLISPDDLIDHPHVSKLLWDGWVSHIPIHCLVAASSWALAHFIGDLPPVHTEDEHNMTWDEYCEAVAIFLHLICSHLPSPNIAAIASAFEAHFTLITTANSFTCDFEIWRSYCIHLRMCCFQNSESYNPSHFHEGLWRFCKTQHDQVKISNQESHLLSFESALVATRSFRTSKSGSSSAPSVSSTPASVPLSAAAKAPLVSPLHAMESASSASSLPISHVTAPSPPMGGSPTTRKVSGLALKATPTATVGTACARAPPLPPSVSTCMCALSVAPQSTVPKHILPPDVFPLSLSLSSSS
ncbi:hypothetical protein HYDPIDRAFT_33941 [Hydnomerulius pinastri MD-312]|uniref:Uncharacterized protein n=1 Tax=Hydnomerulius pinastri MD-312 TaxID=994086 RepID=A0A0C9W811_9AGAM|nr:hypothetical protein HYDPIDRAFT_33941 [Hydnomerulius pinastri MD-312]